MEDRNYSWETVQEYRGRVRHTCSVLGWALAALTLLTLVVGLFIELAAYLLSHYKVMGLGAEIYKILQSDWFSVAGTSLIGYALVLPVVFSIMDHVPEVIPEKKRMRIGKFIMFFILAQGFGYILNFAGGIINMIVASMTGRNAAAMNPVNGLLDGMSWLTLLYVSVIGPIIEEYVFRWKLLNRLRPLGEKAAILFSAVTFGLLHGNLTQMLYATAIGIVFGYVAVKTGRIKYNCIMHIMVNSFSTLLVLLIDRGGLFLLFILATVPFIVIGLVIAAIIIFCVNVKRTWLAPGDWPEGVAYRDFSSAMFLNSGVLVFALLNLLTAAFYLLAA